jgi:SAM-dependent methyltransferase
MYSATAEIYDVIYSFKDYAGEAAKIREIVARDRPGARTILDVACGTGEHARLLSDGFEVDGVDAEPKFVEIARAKNPAGHFALADMRSFQLEKRYDVVQCLFSAIGHLLTPRDIVAALKCFRSHLAPGGIVLVEPWLLPEVYQTGRCDMLTVEKPDLKLCRMNTCGREGDVSVVDFDYLIGTAEGIRHVREDHRLALVSREQMARHFETAGLRCELDPIGLTGRGLFIAR